MMDKIEDTLSAVAEGIHGSEVPDNVYSYLRTRIRMQERVFIEAQDTAYMHGCWVIDHKESESWLQLDEVGWMLLYDTLSKEKKLPLSFFKGVSFHLSSDKMKKKMGCKFDSGIFNWGAPVVVSVAFDGVKMGLWEMDEVKDWVTKTYPDVPIFKEEEWNESVKKHIGEGLEDMVDMDIPQGGDDVFIL